MGSIPGIALNAVGIAQALAGMGLRVTRLSIPEKTPSLLNMPASTPSVCVEDRQSPRYNSHPVTMPRL
jgi:hypothetical protein